MSFSKAIKTFIRGGLQAIAGEPEQAELPATLRGRLQRAKVRSFGADGNGLTIDELFMLSLGESITFDDIIVLPSFVDEPPPMAAVDLRVELAPGLLCNPVVSSPMDTVTEWRMAIQMALNGCLSVLHINLSIDEMIEQARRVKRFQMGLIWDPVCLHQHQLVKDARRQAVINGYSTYPVTEGPDGTGKFLGLVTRNCVDALETNPDRPITEVMLPLEKLLVVGDEDVNTLEAAKSIFRANPGASKLPILFRDGRLRALVNRKNVVASQKYPYTLTDANNQLRVGAAVSTHKADDVRVERLVEAGVDVIVIDSSQGGTGYAVKRIKQIRALNPDVIIIAGNVVTPGQTVPLMEAGAHAVRVGMGSGSICITQGQYGLGRAQGSAIYHVGEGSIADGGIRSSGDAFKALCLGANAIMVGSYIAGCDEAPGDLIEFEGRRYRRYRGMGSLGAMAARGAERYGGMAGNVGEKVVAQGVSDLAPVTGPLDDRLAEMHGGIKGAMSQHGCTSIPQLHQAVREGRVRFERRSPAAKTEGDAHITARRTG